MVNEEDLELARLEEEGGIVVDREDVPVRVEVPATPVTRPDRDTNRLLGTLDPMYN
jgi:hypothetical protein